MWKCFQCDGCRSLTPASLVLESTAVSTVNFNPPRILGSNSANLTPGFKAKFKNLADLETARG